MRIVLKKNLESDEILKRIKILERKKVLSGREKNKLMDYKKAYKAYEENGEMFYIEELVAELALKRFREVFTLKRIEVINQLNKRCFDSIAELSRHLKRDIKNIYEDLKRLESLGIVKLNKQGKNIKPVLDIETISIELLEA